jgi:hypothetical protein
VDKGRYFVLIEPTWWEREVARSRRGGIKYMGEPSFDNGALLLAAGLSS